MMNNHIRTILYELEEKLNQISYDYDDTIELCGNSISEILSHTEQVKAYVLENSFENQEEEIHFFKHLKPKFTSKLIYFKKVMKLEKLTPIGSNEVKINFFNNQLLKLNISFTEDADFYLYYRHNNEYLDKTIFTRCYDDVCPNVDPAYFDMDHRFSTSHDNSVAKVLANDMLQHYIENKIKYINEVKSFPETSTFEDNNLKWTGNKSDLIELIYALHYAGVINFGTAGIAEITRGFEKLFNINLGKFYRTKSAIKDRKSTTKFIDSLKKYLSAKIYE